MLVQHDVPLTAEIDALGARSAGRVLGIDPGIAGALALLDRKGGIISVQDMPTVTIGTKQRIASAQLADLIAAWAPERAIVEAVSAMPKQGVSSTFAFGYAAGILEGICAALDLSVTLVQPAVWKRAMRVTKDKGFCRMVAQRRWPEQAGMFARVKDADRAEACLLALYGCGA